MTDACSFPPPSRLVLDLDALVANRQTIIERVGPAVEVAGVVKADAYGIGLAPVARALVADGCRTFFVAHVGEAVELRAVLDAMHHPETRIFVLNGLTPGDECRHATHRLSPVLGSMAEVADWSAFRAASGTMVGAALHVDTGMNRHGLSLAEARALAADASAVTAAGLTLVMSHLACADEPGHPLNTLQLARFGEVRGLFPGLPASLANSSGIFLGPEHHFDLVRPGIAVYGGAIVSGEPTPMRPVARLEAAIVQVREAEAGETVGYGARQTLRRRSRLALLSVGYADGFHRSASSSDSAAGARGLLHGRSVPVVGRVSMDLMVVDVTDVPEAARGDVVELIGDTVTVQEVAARMGTIDYEVLTSLGRRYGRVYRGG